MAVVDMGDAEPTLNGYNQELSKCESLCESFFCSRLRLTWLAHAGIDELEQKKKSIQIEIDNEQQKKTDVQGQLRDLTEKLSRINDTKSPCT